jgi:hypothetical protein
MKPIQVLNRFFEARDCMHLVHHNTTSYAEHKALGKFYDKWIELVDTFIETYAGRYDRINGFLLIDIKVNINSTEYLQKLRAFVSIEAMAIIAPTLDSDLSNILADMLTLINHTLYMLTLK